MRYAYQLYIFLLHSLAGLTSGISISNEKYLIQFVIINLERQLLCPRHIQKRHSMLYSDSNGLLGMHVRGQIQQAIRVSPFVIIPSHDLEELQKGQ
jgi:hypothetical protein